MTLGEEGQTGVFIIWGDNSTLFFEDTKHQTVLLEKVECFNISKLNSMDTNTQLFQMSTKKLEKCQTLGQ